MNKEIQIKVIPSSKTGMHIFGYVVSIDNGFLEIASDECLASAYWHEMGHLKQRKIMVAIVSVSLVVFFQVMILMLPLLSVFSLWLMLGLFYLWLCFFCRLGELHADLYSLKHTSKNGLIQMLSGEGSRLDSTLAKIFWFLRFHPSRRKRLQNLRLRL